MRNVVLLIGTTAVVWLVAAYLARDWLGWGDQAVLFSGVAALLCLLPAAGTMVWCQRVVGGKPEQQLAAVMGGTGLRLLFVIGAGMALYWLHPAFFFQRFWLWIVFFYLVTLALEVTLLARQTTAGGVQQE